MILYILTYSYIYSIYASVTRLPVLCTVRTAGRTRENCSMCVKYDGNGCSDSNGKKKFQLLIVPVCMCCWVLASLVAILND